MALPLALKYPVSRVGISRAELGGALPGDPTLKKRVSVLGKTAGDGQVVRRRKEAGRPTEGQRQRLIAHILDLLEEYSISSDEIRHEYSNSLHEDMRVTPKYLDPASGETWAGRGRAPRWILEAEVAGVSRDQFRIEPGKGRRHSSQSNSFGRGLRQQIIRDHISDVAHGLARTGGVDSLTMEQIARATGISRAALYNHFPLKEALIAHWADRRLSDLLAAALPQAEMSGNVGEAVRTLWRATVPWWGDHRDYAVPYLHCFFCKPLNSGGMMPRNSFSPIYVRLLTRARLPAGRAEQPHSRLARHLHFAYLAALIEWSSEDSLSLVDAIDGALRTNGWLS